MQVTLPQSPEAEAGVLGAIFADETVIGEVSLMLAPEQFSLAKHALIFEVMLKLYDTMEGISVATLREMLNRTPRGKQVTDLDLYALADVTQFLPSMAGSHARIVRDLANRRRLVYLGQDLIAEAGKGEKPTEDLIARAEREIDQLTAGGREQTVMDARTFARAVETYEVAQGLSTGLDVFDEHTRAPAG